MLLESEVLQTSLISGPAFVKAVLSCVLPSPFLYPFQSWVYWGRNICFSHGYRTGSVHSFMFELYCYNHWAISFPETNKWAGNFVFSDLLNITASPNNGTRGSLYHTLKNPPVLQKPQQFVQCQSVQPIATNQLHRSCNCSITTAVIVQ